MSLSPCFLVATLLLTMDGRQATAMFLAPKVLDVESPAKNEVFQDTVRCLFGDDDYKYCDSQSVTIKYTIWNRVQDGCNSCRDEDLKVFKFMAYLCKKRAKVWQQVLHLYDPEGKFKRKNSVQWKQYGIAM